MGSIFLLSFKNYVSQVVTLIVNELLLAHSKAVSDLLYHGLRYALDVFAYCLFQV